MVTTSRVAGTGHHLSPLDEGKLPNHLYRLKDPMDNHSWISKDNGHVMRIRK